MIAWTAAALATPPTIDEPLRTGARAPDDAAVVVGAEDYAFLPDVPYAERDARAFADFLLYTRGVPSERVEVVTLPTRERLVAALERAGRATEGTVWIYFAGHGAASPATGERLLLGVDAVADEASFVSRGLPIGEVTRLAGAGGARVQVVADTCYAGASRSGEALLVGRRFAVPSYATVGARSAEWAAAAPDELAGPYPGAEHGAFTYLAVGALRGWADGEVDGAPDGSVTAEEARLFVRRALAEAGITGQHPEWVGDSALVLAEGGLEALPAGTRFPAVSEVAPAPAAAAPSSWRDLARTPAGLACGASPHEVRMTLGMAEVELGDVWVYAGRKELERHERKGLVLVFSEERLVSVEAGVRGLELLAAGGRRLHLFAPADREAVAAAWGPPNESAVGSKGAFLRYDDDITAAGPSTIYSLDEKGRVIHVSVRCPTEG